MAITFRKFTASARLSEETTAYDTEVLFDGKHIGHCRNDGRGGMGFFVAKPGVDDATIEAAQAWARAQPILEVDGTQMEIRGQKAFFERIEDYCDHLADETLAHRQLASQIKRLLKTHILLIDPQGEPGVRKIKQAWGPHLKAAVLKRYPQATILNALPVEQAIEAAKNEQARQLAHECAPPRPQSRSMKP